MAQLPVDASLLQLDSTLRRFILFCATYHGLSTNLSKHLNDRLTDLCKPEQYLQTPIQLDHACNLLLESELFAFHSGRMSEILLEDAETVSRYFLFDLLIATEYLIPVS